uniref:Uncharacterized protein n=1 Tax=Arundo donax TaxID=35708 RepID=A0A0A8ZHR0_ARUDO
MESHSEALKYSWTTFSTRYCKFNNHSAHPFIVRYATNASLFIFARFIRAISTYDVYLCCATHFFKGSFTVY